MPKRKFVEPSSTESVIDIDEHLAALFAQCEEGGRLCYFRCTPLRKQHLEASRNGPCAWRQDHSFYRPMALTCVSTCSRMPELSNYRSVSLGFSSYDDAPSGDDDFISSEPAMGRNKRTDGGTRGYVRSNQTVSEVYLVW